MTILIRNGAPLTRQRLLTTAASSAALLTAAAVAKPYLSRAPGRRLNPGNPQSVRGL